MAAWTAAAGLPGDTAEDLQLALGEALANAVEHAYAASPGDGECSYRLARGADGSVRVEVRDTGLWRPPPADRGYRGRGLELIEALGTDVEVEHASGVAGTTVRFRVAPAVPGPVVRLERTPVAPPGDGGTSVSAPAARPGGFGFRCPELLRRYVQRCTEPPMRFTSAIPVPSAAPARVSMGV